MCKMGLNTLPQKGGVEIHFGGVETQNPSVEAPFGGVNTHLGVTPPQTGAETQTNGSQHLYRVENDTLHKGTF